MCRAGAGVDVGVPFGRTRRVLDRVDGRRVLDAMLVPINRAGATDAEELAAIADGLALPSTVESAFARLHGRGDPAAG